MSGLNSDTELLIHGNGSDGSTDFIDVSDNNHSITVNGNTQKDTAQKQFGTASLLLDGSGDYLEIADSPSWDLYGNLTEDWTIDCWIRPPTISGTFTILAQFEDGPNQWAFKQINDTISHNVGSEDSSLGHSLTSGSVLTANTWHHVALIRVGNDIGLYVDGQQVANQIDIGDTDTFAAPFRIGTATGSSTFFNGHIDELRVQRSNYFGASPNSSDTDTITVSTEEYHSVNAVDTLNENTKLLAHFNGNDGDTTTFDSSSQNHNITLNGNTELDTIIKKFGTASCLLPGASGDYVSVADSADWTFGTGRFTIDFWAYFNDFSNTPPPFNHRQDGNNAHHLQVNANDAIWTLRLGGTTLFSQSGVHGMSTGTWHHIALIRGWNDNDNDWAITIDGTAIATFTDSSSISDIAGDILIGAWTPTTQNMDGQLDEFRILKGEAFWTSNFTPPNEEYFITDISVPDAPTNLTATKQGTDQIDLSWDAPVDDGGSPITGYKIERESPAGGGFSTIVADTGNTNTTFSDTGLDPNTQYNYRVSAINDKGASSPSNEASATTDVDVPGSPTSLTIFSVTQDEISIIWDAPTNDGGEITGYKIERESPVGGGWSTIVADTGNTNTTYLDKGLDESIEYNYRVSTINSVGTSNPSNTANITTSECDGGLNSNTKLLLHLNELDGSTTFTDTTNNTDSIIGRETAQIDDSQQQFGHSSLLLDGDSDSLLITPTTPSDFDFPNDLNNIYTIDCWIRPRSNNIRILDTIDTSIEDSFGFFIGSGGDLNCRYTVGGPSPQTSPSLSTDSTVTLNTWQHVAFIMIGNGSKFDMGIYIDGQQDSYAQTSLTGSILPFNNDNFIIGSFRNVGDFFDGWIDEFRIQKSNTLNASPNSAKTDTITVPTVQYCELGTGGSFVTKDFDPLFKRLLLRNDDATSGVIFDYFTGQTFIK